MLVSGLPGRIKGNGTVGRPRRIRGLAEHDTAPPVPQGTLLPYLTFPV